MPDLKIQGPNGKNVTLESVNDVVKHFSQPLVSSSAQSSASKSKQKKKKEESLTEDANTTQQSNSLVTELKMSSKKKKKKRLSHESLANGHHTSDEKDAGGIDHIKDTSVVCYMTYMYACAERGRGYSHINAREGGGGDCRTFFFFSKVHVPEEVQIRMSFIGESCIYFTTKSSCDISRWVKALNTVVSG